MSNNESENAKMNIYLVDFISKKKHLFYLCFAFLFAFLGYFIILLIPSMWDGYDEYLNKISNKPFSISAVLILTMALVLWTIFIYHEYLKRNIIIASDEDKKEETNRLMHRIIFDLDLSILRYSSIGLALLTVTTFTLIVLAFFVFRLFDDTIQNLMKSHDFDTPYWVFLFIVLILRTSLIGTFIVAFLIYIIKFTNSSFDQAVRFNKRKHAALFLINVFSLDKEMKIQVRSVNDLVRIMDSFNSWNVNIESAFTQTKSGELKINESHVSTVVDKYIAKIEKEQER